MKDIYNQLTEQNKQEIRELVEEIVKEHVPIFIPYQRCPICNGAGVLYSRSTMDPYTTCLTCGGAGIIPQHLILKP